MLQQIVDAMGYESSVAGMATEAWRILGSDPVALVLLDIKMPAVHGDLFLRYMREKGCHSEVIAVSGYLTKDTLQNLKQWGVAKIVAKPFKVSRLAADINEVIGDPDTVPADA